MAETFTQPGAANFNFWGQAKSFANRGGFANGLNPAVTGRIWYVNTNTDNDAADNKGPVGHDGNSGLSPLLPFATVDRAFEMIDCYDVVVISGDVREQVVAPLGVYDVTLVGAANLPRQATSGGVPTGGGSTWRGPASPTALTPLLELKAQGWRIANIEFTPVASSAAIRLTRSASVDTTDASHCIIDSCLFAANGVTTPIGVEDNGGCRSVVLRNNRFESLASALLSLNTAAAVSQDWDVNENYFNQNTDAINLSLTKSRVRNNFIKQGINDTNIKLSVVKVAGQGSLNMVINNIFPDAVGNVTIAKGYKPGTNDIWRNYTTDTAAYTVAVPA